MLNQAAAAAAAAAGAPACLPHARAALPPPRPRSESWDLSKSLLPSRLAWNLTRAGWSAKQATADAAASADRALTSLTSMDEEDGGQGGYQANPNDPMKFFQSGQDDFKQDALLFTAGVALLYFMVQAWAGLEKM